MNVQPTKIAIACQGGGSHCAFTAGVLAALLRETRVEDGRFFIDHTYELVGLSGTSGGAISAYLAWIDLLRLREPPCRLPSTLAVERFWESMKAQPFPWPPSFPSPDLFSNGLQLLMGGFDGVLPMVSPSPNAITEQAQQQLGQAIEAAALLSGEAAEGKPPLSRQALKALGPPDLPLLMIGAANIDDSEFAPLVSTPRNRPMTAQLLASAALPELYPAVIVEAPRSADAHNKQVAMRATRASQPPSEAFARYWDGLLSQNPPLGDFLSVPLPVRPEEIWIIRINPAQRVFDDPLARRRTRMLPAEIRDRRNELAGNLSLEQEKRFIRKVNQLVVDYPALKDQHQVVQTWGIALDGPWDCPADHGHALDPDCHDSAEGGWCPPVHAVPQQLLNLDATSKLNRFPAFIDALTAYGATCAIDFLERRRDLRRSTAQRTQAG